MTRETYDRYHALQMEKGKHQAGRFSITDPTYIPKHAAQPYNVWRVLGPLGPQETVTVYGLDEAQQLTVGCWDAEITTIDGKVIR